MNIYKLIKDRLQGKAPRGAKRSSEWRKVRKAHLKLHPKCQLCGSKRKVEVHHIVPFHIAPDQELEFDNLITLCENKKYGINCHLLMGHRGNYRKFNITCKADVKVWHSKIKGD